MRSSTREPDIVVVGSPPGHHFAQAKAALEAGAHVMCEKPFTIDPADAWELDRTVKRTGKQLFVSYGWNYRPMVIQAHRIMHDDGIGDIEQVSLHMDSVTRELLSETGDYPGADPATVPQADTWSRPETSGGGYGQAQLTHLLGVALWLTDLRGQDVFALMSAPLDAQVELHDAVAMRFTNGAIGTMSGASGHLGACRQPARRRGPRRRLAGPVPPRPAGQHPVALPPRAMTCGCRSSRMRGCTTAGDPSTPSSTPGSVRSPANNSPAELGARTVGDPATRPIGRRRAVSWSGSRPSTAAPPEAHPRVDPRSERCAIVAGRGGWRGSVARPPHAVDAGGERGAGR